MKLMSICGCNQHIIRTNWTKCRWARATIRLKIWSNQSRKPPKMTSETFLGVAIAIKLCSRPERAAVRTRAVGAWEHWRTCSKVSSFSPQPGQRSDWPYNSLFWRFVFDKLWINLDVPIRWNRDNCLNAWECTSQSTVQEKLQGTT